MGSRVQRHEHEVKGLPAQGNVLWIQTVSVEHVLNCSRSQQSIFRILLANRLCRSQDFHPSTNAKVARKQSRQQSVFIPRKGKETLHKPEGRKYY